MWKIGWIRKNSIIWDGRNGEHKLQILAIYVYNCTQIFTRYIGQRLEGVTDQSM